MNKYLQILKRVKLLSGLRDEEILSVLKCLKAKVKTFTKDSIIYSEGDKAEYIGIILSGEVEIQSIDYKGNANIISTLYPSDLIAAVVCYSSNKYLPFDVLCAADCEVLILDILSLIRPCCNLCANHSKIIENMLNVIADKNIQLIDKIGILTKRTIREKILSYLFAQSKKAKSAKFQIYLSRRQMAEYLSVDRSALSRELGNMRDEGILEFDKNIFILKST